MIINNSLQAIASIYASNALTKQTAAQKDAAATSKPDEIILSSAAQSFSQTLQKLQSMPAVRQEKVEAYSAQISAGQYSVDSQALAAKMLNTRY